MLHSAPMLETLRLPPTGSLRARVPASTSNLGPGFDLIGLALDLPLGVTARRDVSLTAHRLTLGTGEERAWPTGGDNLLLRGLDAGLRASHAASDTFFDLSVESEIPTRRGLGSSAAAIVAGLTLGACVGPHEVTRENLLELALAIEGHPDNVSPALFGGCVLSLPVRGEATRIVRVALHASLAYAVAWPATTLETAFARSILPKSVLLSDAVENSRRLALLLEGLRSGDADLLRLGCEDRLHVPYRLPHIPGGAEALAAARESGALIATISGSGSALFAIATRDNVARVADAMRIELDRRGGPATAKTPALAQGARVELA